MIIVKPSDIAVTVREWFKMQLNLLSLSLKYVKIWATVLKRRVIIALTQKNYYIFVTAAVLGQIEELYLLYIYIFVLFVKLSMSNFSK